MMNVFENEGFYGIEENNTVLYDADFKKKEHAEAILTAHANGAESFFAAIDMLPANLQHLIMGT